MTGGGGREQTEDALFAELKRSGSAAARTELIELHLPLARNLAGRYRYTPEPRDDLEQVASLALVKAVDRFDPTRGVPFGAYAVATILGELKRHMRDTTWAVHVPRALKERILAVERAERSLSSRLGGAPTLEELAAEAGVSAEQALEALGARVAHDALPLEPPGSGEDAPAGGLFAGAEVEDFSGAVEERVTLSHALRGLRPRERTILHLRFAEDLTQTEIANRVGVSQMYVSRLLRAALEQVREQLEEPD
jgi:RNA polymerase sigma-B factor